ncbi:hypothetical protein PMAYCL1PPCAC_30536, partial [Pristionchus mayeri]
SSRPLVSLQNALPILPHLPRSGTPRSRHHGQQAGKEGDAQLSRAIWQASRTHRLLRRVWSGLHGPLGVPEPIGGVGRIIRRLRPVERSPLVVTDWLVDSSPHFPSSSCSCHRDPPSSFKPLPFNRLSAINNKVPSLSLGEHIDRTKI